MTWYCWVIRNPTLRDEKCCVASRVMDGGKFQLQAQRIDIPGPSRMMQCIVTQAESCGGGRAKVWLEVDGPIVVDGVIHNDE